MRIGEQEIGNKSLFPVPDSLKKYLILALFEYHFQGEDFGSEINWLQLSKIRQYTPKKRLEIANDETVDFVFEGDMDIKLSRTVTKTSVL